MPCSTWRLVCSLDSVESALLSLSAFMAVITSHAHVATNFAIAVGRSGPMIISAIVLLIVVMSGYVVGCFGR